MKKGLIWIVLFTFLTGCQSNPDDLDYDSYLYEISDQNGHKDYLLGSLHTNDRKVYEMTPQLEEVFYQIDSLALEANPMEIDLAMTYDTSCMTDNPASLYAQPETLAAWSDKKAFSNLDPTVYNVLTINAVVKMQYAYEIPFLAVGGTGVTGIDRLLATTAQSADLPIWEIEGVDRQLNMMKELSAIAPDFFMEQILDLEKIANDAQIIQNSYQNKDIETLMQLLTGFESQHYAEQAEAAKQYLVHERNRFYLSAIEDYLEDDACTLIAIGVYHLYGTDGMIEQLTSKGYQVRCLKE